MNPSLYKKIYSIVGFFETSRTTPSYDTLTILPDGPDKIRQVTFGAYQVTEFGNLRLLLQLYCNKGGGAEIPVFKPLLPLIGKLPSKWTNRNFVEALKRAGKERVMEIAQDEFFQTNYMDPAIQWCKVNKLVLPLSLLVIFDSFIHSGGIFAFLRNEFPEATPAKGGDEKKWVTTYVNARDKWLENHSRELLQHTDYRTDSFILAIREDNWNLDKPFKVVNFPDKEEKKPPHVKKIIN
jgi:chitosanase